MLRVEKVVKKFGGVTALGGVDLEVAEREIVAIIGPNGSGKTTLVNVISGAIRPDSGKIYFRGEDITEYPMHKRVKLGIVRSFQLPMLFEDGTVEENLMVAAAATSPLKYAIDKDAVRNVAELFHLDSILGQKVKKLSEGQRKLLDIALCFVWRPKLLMLDEPTSSVSSKEKGALMQRIIDAVKRVGASIIIVEHDLDVVRQFADRVVVMEYGAVTKIATPSQI